MTSYFQLLGEKDSMTISIASPLLGSAEEATIAPRTKAIVPVHLYGNPCIVQRLEAVASTKHLVIIEDACQAHGANIDGKPVGGFGTGCFSFYATKNMTTLDKFRVKRLVDWIRAIFMKCGSHGFPPCFARI